MTSRLERVEWYSGGTGTVGIVICVDESTKERRAYIGVGAGIDARADAQRIKDYGAKLRIAELEALIEILKQEGRLVPGEMVV